MTVITSVARKYLGEAMIAVGVLHTGAAWSSFKDEFRAMYDDGLWGSVDVAGSGLGGEALWFAVSGAAYLLTGMLVRSHLRATGTLPMAFSAGMALLGLAITVALPTSGAWMALACGALAILVSAVPPEAEANEVGEPSARPELVV